MSTAYILSGSAALLRNLKTFFYEIKEVNGHMVNNNDVFYKITGGSLSHKDGNITHYLNFNKIKNGKEHYGNDFENKYDGNLNEAYQKCISIAPDTTGFFPSSAKYAVKPK